MKFSEPISSIDNIELKPKRARPTPAGYKLIVVKVEEKVSSQGHNPMLEIGFDVADGAYQRYFASNPVRYFREYGTNFGKQLTKKMLQDFVTSNPGTLSEGDLDGNEFDHNRLVGLTIGGILNYKPNGFLTIEYLTTVEKALAANVVPKAYAPHVPGVAPQVQNKYPF